MHECGFMAARGRGRWRVGAAALWGVVRVAWCGLPEVLHAWCVCVWNMCESSGLSASFERERWRNEEIMSDEKRGPSVDQMDVCV